MLQPRQSAATGTPWAVLSASAEAAWVSIDANGNLTGDGTNTYDWDAENRLVAVLQGATTLASFVYDGRGRRASKTAGSVTIHRGTNSWIGGSSRKPLQLPLWRFTGSTKLVGALPTYANRLGPPSSPIGSSLRNLPRSGP